MAESGDERRKFGIIVAVIAGLLALGMMFVFLKDIKKQAVVQETTMTTLPTRTILVAVKDLPVGHALNVNADFKEIEIPVTKEITDFLNKCVPAEEVQLFEGRILAGPLAAENPLLYSYLAESFNFDEKFQRGFLKTLILDRENLFGSRLIPGDRVDILVTMPKKSEPESKKEDKTTLTDLANDPNALVDRILSPLQVMQQDVEMQTFTILEDVEVFMVGSLIEFDRIQLGYDEQSEVENANEITFRLDKSDAITLTQYYNSSNTKISLLLRPRK